VFGARLLFIFSHNVINSKNESEKTKTDTLVKSKEPIRLQIDGAKTVRIIDSLMKLKQAEQSSKGM
jgi:hypothetical protein